MMNLGKVAASSQQGEKSVGKTIFCVDQKQRKTASMS
jgi:hypothetical protein